MHFNTLQTIIIINIKNKTTINTNISIHKSLISFHFIIFSTIIKSNKNLLLKIIINNLKKTLLPFKPTNIPNTHQKK